ncbi:MULTISPECIES: GMC family oxidoreductase [Citromicrobium]|uniref:GMC family oxidoreductase n=1 Tax=Citromicrobium TaxID=72173 RepID=UPI0001DD0A2C|nr:MULTISPECIES: GMC family oxidoreductase N-terminal domain-containing protein [Citromicrobium]ALG60453.1 choline dehydrogenase [Citromicrobium sp. JL477]
MTERETYDFIVIGAGSAGCVLANRLTADGRYSVLLLEAGGDDRPSKEPRQFFSNTMIHTPVGYAKTLRNPAVNWLYDARSGEGPDARHIAWPRGKVLGGSSSINGMLYVRGQRADYDHWRQLGCAGWGWDEVEPYFRRAEDRAGAQADSDLGTGGPLRISDPSWKHPVSQAAIDACEAFGLPHRDYNGPDQEAVDWFQLTIDGGRRMSAATAYLDPARRRSNLRIVTRSHVNRIAIESGRAIHVEYERDGQRAKSHAEREIVPSTGAIGSPQILQLSGVGDTAHLGSLGIETIADLPGTGANLQDHYIANAVFRLTADTPSINSASRGIAQLGHVARYLVRKTGLLSLSAAHVAAFLKTREGLVGPDVQFHILPASMNLAAYAADGSMELEREPRLTFAVCQLRPASRGHVSIASADPREHPDILANYLTDPLDRSTLAAGLRAARQVAACAPLASLIDHESLPGSPCASDKDLVAYARSTGGSIYHPVGTCAMGTGPESVVGPDLRVHGVAELRVVDASVMPTINSGNTNAPTLMIAEKASDMILAEARTGANA